MPQDYKSCGIVSWAKNVQAWVQSKNFIFESMELAERKLRLIERLMRVRSQVVLEQLDELLIRAEMESRAEESLKAIDNNDPVALDDFTQNNQSWIKKKPLK